MLGRILFNIDIPVRLKDVCFISQMVFTAKVKLLVSILNSTSSIQCSAAYLNLFDIAKLAFKTANFNQKGLKHFNVLPIELTFDSDENYDFLIDE